MAKKTIELKSDELYTKLVYKGKRVISLNAVLHNSVPILIALERREGGTVYENFHSSEILGDREERKEYKPTESPFKNIIFTYPKQIFYVELSKENPLKDFEEVCARAENL